MTNTDDKIILTDCDGVLCDWNGAFSRFMSENGYPMISETESNYAIEKRHNVTNEMARQHIEEFNHSDRISNLEPHADSQEYVARLRDEGYRFIVVTSLSDHVLAKDARMENLQRHFGDAILELHCLPLGVHKGEKLRDWAETKRFWIEDHVENAVAGAKLGLRSIVIDHPYNIKYEENDELLYARVSHDTPWADIYEVIKGAEE